MDPLFKIANAADIIGSKPGCLLFQTTSDEFFENYKLSNLLPAPGRLDFAFLDGMHHFEFLLRDFYNTEANAHPGTVVVLHDCIPVNPQSTFRQGKDRRRPVDTTTRRAVPARGAWAGDVWKTVQVLRAYRPDLDIRFFDAIPTGLVVIRNLDPGNTVLKDRYEEAVSRFMDADLQPGWYDDYMDSILLRPTRGLNDRERMRAGLGV
ncbi:MAG: class I SAM-dependent methyltransferase [Roseococcus sp.]|nr:class I SAM-dependent methyltransferase [Roseococcus sp.]